MKSLAVASLMFGAASLAAISYHFRISKPAIIPPAQSTPISERGVFILDPEKQIGVVGLNQAIQGTFTVVNESGHAITLSEPMKSCSCTTAELSSRELAAGERCTLSFEIKTGDRRVPRVETVGLVYTSRGQE